MNKIKTWILVGAALIGALLFRIRGGLWDIWQNKIWFPLFIGVAYSWLFDWSWLLGILGFLVAYVAQQCCGWGAYRGSLAAGATPASEVAMIDEVLNSSSWLVAHPRLWGFCGCSLRGLLSSYQFGLLSQSLIVGLSGLLVGFCYAIPTLLLWPTKYHNTKAAWNLGEFLEGALWISTILLFTNVSGDI